MTRARRHRATHEQLFHAAVDMYLARGTAEHGARTEAFDALFAAASVWTRLTAAARGEFWIRAQTQ